MALQSGVRVGAGLLLGAWLVACGGDSKDSSYAKLASELEAKLQKCKLEASKTVAAADEIQDETEACLAHCLLDASCTDLRGQLCGEGEGAGSTITECYLTCPTTPRDGFACKSGTKILHSSVCDGQLDCAAGEDEADCKPYTCADGEKLDRVDDFLECDGVQDCRDGSDEEGCEAICS